MSEELIEFKATGEDSSVAEPVSTGAHKRKADKSGHKDSAGALPKEEKSGGPMHSPRKADKTMGEEALKVFGETGLSEELQGKLSTVFEAQVNERVHSIEEELREQFQTDLTEGLQEAIAEMADKIDSYMDYVVSEWMEENQLAVENGLKVEVAESLIGDMRSVFETHHIAIPDDEEAVDVIESLQNEIEELKALNNEQTQRVLDAESALQEAEELKVFGAVTEGLTDTDVERMKTLCDGIEYSDIAEFQSKVETIKEHFYGEGVKTLTEETVDEVVEFDGGKEEINPNADPLIRSIAQAMSKSFNS